MKIKFFNSFRFLIIAISLISTIPLTILLIYHFTRSRKNEINNYKENASALVKLIIDDEGQVIDGSRQLLIFVADIIKPDVKNIKKLNGLFFTIKNKYRRYLDIGLINKKGIVISSADSEKINKDVSKNEFFLESLKGKDFAIGKYEIVPEYSGQVINLGLPITDQKNEVEFVLYASLKVYWWKEIEADIAEDSSKIFGIDDEGDLLASYPANSAKLFNQLVSNHLLKKIINQKSGFFEYAPFDNKDYFYSFGKSKVRYSGEHSFLILCTPEQALFLSTNQTLNRNLVMIVALFLLFNILIWLIGKRLVLLPAQSLQYSLNAIANGDLSVRCNISNNFGKLSTIAKSFNNMAEALEIQTKERKSAESSLQKNELLFRTSLQVLQEGFAILSPIKDAKNKIIDFRYDFINEKGCKLIDKSKEDVLSHTLLELFPGFKDSELFQKCVKVVEIGEPIYEESYTYGEIESGARLLNRAFELTAVKLGDGLIVTWKDITKKMLSIEKIRYQANLLENVNDAILATDENFRITEWNLAAEKLYGWKKKEVLGKKVWDVIISEFSDEQKKNALKIMHDGGTFCTEVLQYTKSKKPIYVEGRTIALRDQMGRVIGYVSVNRDISERKKLESELKSRERRSRALFEKILIGLTMIDLDGKFIRVNPAFCKFVLYNENELLQKRFHDIIHKNDAEQMKAMFSGFMNGTINSADLENRFVRQDGKTVWGRINAVLSIDPQKGTKYIIAVVSDITNRKQAEEEKSNLFRKVQNAQSQLQKLSERLIEAQETERRNISRELHDDIGQTLTAIKINLTTFQTASVSQPLQNCVKETIDLVEHSLQRVRELSLNLHTSVLDDLGLVSAIDSLIKRISERSNIKTTFNSEPAELKINKRFEITIYRITQEALTNILKHSKATEVNIFLLKEENKLKLFIKDNGIGFNVEKAKAEALNGQSIGLLSMEERAHLSGGELKINSVKNKGTEIRLELNIN